MFGNIVRLKDYIVINNMLGLQSNINIFVSHKCNGYKMSKTNMNFVIVSVKKNMYTSVIVDYQYKYVIGIQMYLCWLINSKT